MGSEHEVSELLDAEPRDSRVQAELQESGSMVAEPEKCGLLETEPVEAEEGRTLMAGPE